MSDQGDVTAIIAQQRQEQLEKSQQAFGRVFDTVDRLSEWAERHPEETELALLVSLLRTHANDALNAVTCKILVNGAAVDDASRGHGQ